MIDTDEKYHQKIETQFCCNSIQVHAGLLPEAALPLEEKTESAAGITLAESGSRLSRSLAPLGGFVNPGRDGGRLAARVGLFRLHKIDVKCMFQLFPSTRRHL